MGVRRRRFLRRVAAVVGCLLGLSPLAAQTLSPERAVPHELLVRFKPEASSAQRSAALNEKGAKVLHYFETVDIHHLRLPDKVDVNEALRALLADSRIASAQPNYIRHAIASTPPNDPYWLSGSLWGLQKIQMPAVWSQFTTGTNSVLVMDIDTGIDYTHPDLVANVWYNPGEIAGNGLDDDNDGYADDVHGIDTYNHDSDPMDDHGHGTHTAGTIGATGDNGIGVVGVNWDVKVIACKFIGSNGEGTDAGAIECFNYAVTLKQRGVNIRATNNSWGGTRGTDPFPQALKDAMDAAGNAGILNICAAGNESTSIEGAPFDPASFNSPTIIAVAASDENDQRASFSNYGYASVDLAAPGNNILSTESGGYQYLSGTSMAAPHVTGAVAILATINPTLTTSQLKSILLNTVDAIPAWSGLTVTGGRLNVLQAAAAADQLLSPTDSDADGIPDSWEMFYFNSLDVANATSDFDGDGVSDKDEYLSGTDPKNAASVLRVSGASKDTSGFHCTVATAQGYSYQLQRSIDLSSWTQIGNPAPGTGTVLTFSNSSESSSSRAFYQLVVQRASQ